MYEVCAVRVLGSECLASGDGMVLGLVVLLRLEGIRLKTL